MKHLSKSDYLKYRVHPAYLWYKKNKPQLLPKPDANNEYVFEQGRVFEKYAHKLFVDPIKIEAEDFNLDKILQITNTAIQTNWSVVFEAGFMTEDGLYCRCDVIEKTDEGIILSEIKSSTNVKNSHLYDLAFQRKVLEQLGHKVVSCRVLHVNKFYRRKPIIKPTSIVAIRDVTEEVFGLQSQVDAEIEQAKLVIEQAEVNDHPAFAGSLSEWLEIYRYIHNPPKDSVLNLTSIKPQQVKDFYFNGIETLDQLDPKGLKDRQAWQVLANEKNKPIIDSEGITSFLNSLKFPLYFLDYETSAHVIPFYHGIKPYQQLPFQYSLHKLDSPDSALEHFEYLHTSSTNPARPLIKTLLDEIGEEGTVLAWFDKFEKYCNRTLADVEPEYKDQLHAINKRMKDLRIPFANFSYVDADFGGSTSIKNVLPVVVPELSYKTLGIQEGGSAQRLWQQRVFDKKGNTETVFADLLEYCKLDTLAMVEIYKVLLGVSKVSTNKSVQNSLF